MLKEFNDSMFEDFKNENVSVVQYSAAWCGPCKSLKPIMDKLALEYKDRAEFFYGDIENDAINTASAAGIRGVPTVIIYKGKTEVDRKVGGASEAAMKEFLDNSI
tara:strand:+ start:189 stop:503 length:315 start_codon:yes stop_codon:yes gene_type:complete